MGIDWSKQICGVHQAPFNELLRLMPEVGGMITRTFPDNTQDFTWDVKVTMLMPNMYPCIPNWHTDFVPRVGGMQRFDLVKPYLPMYCWISGPPRTQFKHGFLEPETWHRFTQLDEHRGTMSGDFCWRGFIRATHHGIMEPKGSDYERKHIQVYLDSHEYQW